MSNASLKAKYAEILRSNGISDPISDVVIFKPPGGLAGEHMASICEYVTVHFENGKKSMDFFLKRLLPRSGVLETDRMMGEIMVNEGWFLSSFVSEMENLCNSKLGVNNNIGIRKMFPKIYFSNQDEIVMENLVSQGYFMLDKTELQSFEMARVVVQGANSKGLAKLHGVTYCLIRKAGGKDIFLENNPNFQDVFFAKSEEGRNMLSNMFEPTFAAMLNLMRASSTAATVDAYHKLSPYKGKLFDTLLDAVVDQADIFDVVNHGDCWNNNMMFTPETKANPELAKVLFVDLQTCRLSSPCVDIGYYLFTSAKPDVLARSKEILQVYYDTIREIIEKLGEEFPFTFEDFLLDYGVKSKYGLLFGVLITMALDSIKGHDTSKSTGNIDKEFTAMAAEWMSKTDAKKFDEIFEAVVQKIKYFEMFGKL